MMLDRATIRERFAPSKRMGQNFLMDAGIIGRMAAAVGPAPDEAVLEVGPGLGALTGALLTAGARVHAVELDRKLYAYLNDYYRNEERLTLENGDILAFDPAHAVAAAGGPVRLAGNLPYSISHAIIEWIITNHAAFSAAFLTLQTEVARRLYAVPGTKDYSPQTVALGCFFRVERLFTIPPHAFCPQPNVESTYVRLTADASAAPSARLYPVFRQVVRAAFAHRRKMLRNNLRALPGIDPGDVEAASGIGMRRRAEELTRDEYLRLADAVAELRKGTA